MRPVAALTPRMLLGLGAGLLAAIALGGMLALELLAFGPKASGDRHWLFWTVAIPAYFLLQFFADTALEGFLGANSLALKLTPFVLLALFYAVYFVFIT